MPNQHTPREWDCASIVCAMQGFEARYGYPPTSTDWNPAKAQARGDAAALERWNAGHWPRAQTVQRAFGSWNDALAAAGFNQRGNDTGNPRGDGSEQMRRPGGFKWNPAEVTAAMRAFDARYGRPPTGTDWNPPQARKQGRPEIAERFYRDGCWPHLTTVKQYFGTWNAAMEAAGFTPRPPGRPRERDSANAPSF